MRAARGVTIMADDPSAPDEIGAFVAANGRSPALVDAVTFDIAKQ